MDKLKTRILLISVLLLLLFSVQSVAAISDNDGNLTSESIDLSICDNTDDVSSDELSNNQGDVLSASNELDVLSADEVPYSELDSEISVGGNVELLHDYYICSGGESTITISGDNRIIDGRGAVIDMAGSTIRAFYVSGSGITIKNLTIKNANYNGHGGAIYFSKSGTVENCNFTNNKATSNGGAIYFSSSGTTHEVKNCNFTNNKATGTNSWGGAIMFVSTGNVTNCNFTGNKATGSDSLGGAIFMYSGSVENCNFTNNTASGNGGAVYFDNRGDVTNCNLTNNAATGDGGAIWMSSGSVENCNFTNNTATNGDGGAIWMYSGSVENCNFTNNTASGNGGAVYFYNRGDVTNCNFIGNNATYYGGAIRFSSTGTVTNCNFTNNTASGNGGAVYFYNRGDVTNCNFTDNSATLNGGAVYFYKDSKVTNCNFTNNTASREGGAVYFWDEGTVTNCNFTNNSAKWGGAIYFEREGTVTNCNFTDNSATGSNSWGGAIRMNSGTVTNCNFTANQATFGGAVYFFWKGTVTNCNFTGNNATTGSAIYFYWESDTKTVSNSRLLNNRADTESLEVTKNENNITITFTGNNNLLNAIYSRGDVTFTNVAYWGANGIANTGSSPTTPTRSNKEAGQNITVNIVVNNVIVLNKVITTDENGMIVLDISAGANYYISARHETDSYYTEAETINSTMKFNVNVTSQTTNNKTVNITAKSNIPNEIIDGKLLFILPNGEEISANYSGNGTWWAVHEFDDYGVYEVNASYDGLDNVTINNGTVIINDVRLSVVKSADTTEVVYNSTVQFTINVTNYGHSDATEVEVSDWLPLGLTLVEAGAINSEGKYEVFDSSDKVILIDDETFISFSKSRSSDIIEDGDDRDIVQWNITKIVSEKSVVLVIIARANGLVMGDILNEVTVWYHENDTDIIVNSTNIAVIPANSSVSAEDVEVTYGDAIEVAVTSENATGVSYKVIGADGIVKEGTVNVNENITGFDLAVGEYTVNLTTIVNANYTSSNCISKITVNPTNSSISADDIEVTYGETISIPVSVVNAIEFYYAVVNEDGTIVDEDIIQAGLNITVENLSAGKYNVTLITGVDSNHTSVTNTSKITVNPADSSVSAEDAVASFGDAVSIQVSSANATEISYSITDAKGEDVVNGTLKPGEAITVSDLAASDYTVSLTTVVDANHTSVSNSSKLHIRHIVTITIAPVTGYAGEVMGFTAQFTYENGDPVNEGTAGLTINYEDRELLSASMYSVLSADESVPVSNGQATFNVKLGNPGKYSYVVSYSGGDADDAEAESELTILKANTAVSGVDVSGKPTDKKDVTVTVTDQDNNPVKNGTVTLNLNGKQYNASVENGKAVISVELPNPGEYNATVTYNGNDYYNSSSSSIAVDVEKVNTNVPSAEDVSGNAGEKKDITVKFVDENGNPVKNGTATLTIDGKTYTAEVIDGAATFKDVVLPDKDTVADVYYHGNDYYNASSTTFSIKVKQNNNTEPDNNGTDDNKTTKHVSSKIADANATGNPIAMMLLALFVMVIIYRKK